MGFSKGFTLVELIAVLVIVALVAAAGRSLFFDIGVFRQRGFFEETVSAVRYAQKHAVATGCPVRVEITGTGFTLFRPANAAACAAGPYNTPIADPSGGAATFTRSSVEIGVTLSVHNFIFNADGTASANQTITVGVPGGPTFQVVAATGFVG